jgi:4'-phosphopantetheinyl transferase
MSSLVLQSVDTPVSGVQIWTAHLDALSPAELAELSALLDAGENARAARFHFEQDRRHYVASHGLLRHLLGAALDKPAAALLFEHGAHGKPAISSAALVQGRTPRFNLSHSAGWAMFALAWDREVGIDLESATRLKRDVDGLAGLAARVLSAPELAIWQALPETARDAAFLRAWTRKEAYAKATGRGLLEELIRTDVALDAAAPKSSLTLRSPQEGGIMRDWVLHDLPDPDGFAAAIAVEQKLQQQ